LPLNGELSVVKVRVESELPFDDRVTEVGRLTVTPVGGVPSQPDASLMTVPFADDNSMVAD